MNEKVFAIQGDKLDLNRARYMSKYLALEDISKILSNRRREAAGKLLSGFIKVLPKSALTLLDKTIDYPNEQSPPIFLGSRIGVGCHSDVYAVEQQEEGIKYVAKRVRPPSNQELDQHHLFPLPKNKEDILGFSEALAKEYKFIHDIYGEFVVEEQMVVGNSPDSREEVLYILQPYITGKDIFTISSEDLADENLREQYLLFAQKLVAQIDTGTTIDILGQGNVVIDSQSNKIKIIDPHTSFIVDKLNAVDASLLAERIKLLRKAIN